MGDDYDVEFELPDAVEVQAVEEHAEDKIASCGGNQTVLVGGVEGVDGELVFLRVCDAILQFEATQTSASVSSGARVKIVAVLDAFDVRL